VIAILSIYPIKVKALSMFTPNPNLVLISETVKELHSATIRAIPLAGHEMRQTLTQLSNDLDFLMQSFSYIYQENMNVTLDKLDVISSRKLLELEKVITDLNLLLQKDIRLISKETQSVIKVASQEFQEVIKEIRENLEEIIITVGETAVYVIDRTMYNIILLVALIMLGVGIIFFIWFFFSRKLPKGFVGYIIFVLMVGYLTIFSSMILPESRTFAMQYTNVGLIKRLNRDKVIIIEKPIFEKPHLYTWYMTLKSNKSACMIRARKAMYAKEVTIKKTKKISVWGGSSKARATIACMPHGNDTLAIIAIATNDAPYGNYLFKAFRRAMSDKRPKIFGLW
jgi:hypothetical protein